MYNYPLVCQAQISCLGDCCRRRQPLWLEITGTAGRYAAPERRIATSPQRWFPYFIYTGLKLIVQPPMTTCAVLTEFYLRSRRRGTLHHQRGAQRRHDANTCIFRTTMATEHTGEKHHGRFGDTIKWVAPGSAHWRCLPVFS